VMDNVFRFMTTKDCKRLIEDLRGQGANDVRILNEFVGKSVIASYGNPKPYRVNNILFEANPFKVMF
jgi:hypothetical protein